MNFESHSHGIAYLKVFGFSDTRFDGHNVAAIFARNSLKSPHLTNLNSIRGGKASSAGVATRTSKRKMHPAQLRASQAS